MSLFVLLKKQNLKIMTLKYLDNRALEINGAQYIFSKINDVTLLRNCVNDIILLN